MSGIALMCGCITQSRLSSPGGNIWCDFHNSYAAPMVYDPERDGPLSEPKRDWKMTSDEADYIYKLPDWLTCEMGFGPNTVIASEMDMRRVHDWIVDNRVAPVLGPADIEVRVCHRIKDLMERPRANVIALLPTPVHEPRTIKMFQVAEGELEALGHFGNWWRRRRIVRIIKQESGETLHITSSTQETQRTNRSV